MTRIVWQRARATFSCAAVLALAALASAQAPPGRPPGFGPGFGPANRLDEVKKQLGASDEEWKVIGPKLQQVIAARQQLTAESRGGEGVFGMAPPGRPGAAFQGPGAFLPFGGGKGPAAGPPQPGQILPSFLQDLLKLSDEQKKQLADLQKDVDARLAKMLTVEQHKQLRDFGRNLFGPPGAPPAPPPGARPGANPSKGPAPAQEPAPAAKGPAAEPGPPPAAAPRPGGLAVPPPGNSAISQAQADLLAALKDPKHTASEIEERVAAVRQARQKARADLDAAQRELRLLLTAEQEAVLVALGYLE